uniref:Uncharacterized protein n=1 Tax=Cacopsylla melanoneura TaxID=428564 RepID=A0A8D8YUX0_9HEMI
MKGEQEQKQGDGRESRQGRWNGMTKRGLKKRRNERDHNGKKKMGGGEEKKKKKTWMELTRYVIFCCQQQIGKGEKLKLRPFSIHSDNSKEHLSKHTGNLSKDF